MEVMGLFICIKNLTADFLRGIIFSPKFGVTPFDVFFWITDQYFFLSSLLSDLRLLNLYIAMRTAGTPLLAASILDMGGARAFKTSQFLGFRFINLTPFGFNDLKMLLKGKYVGFIHFIIFHQS